MNCSPHSSVLFHRYVYNSLINGETGLVVATAYFAAKKLVICAAYETDACIISQAVKTNTLIVAETINSALRKSRLVCVTSCTTSAFSEQSSQTVGCRSCWRVFVFCFMMILYKHNNHTASILRYCTMPHLPSHHTGAIRQSLIPPI